MNWIYLSPHYDDVAFSCGGTVWEQTRQGEAVEIWTVCAAQPSGSGLSPYAQMLHERWQTGPDAVTRREEENRLACRMLNSGFRGMSIPDCIYRFIPSPGGAGLVPLINQDQDLFDPQIEPEAGLVEKLAAEILRDLPPGTRLVGPLATGSHVDHRLARSAAERVWAFAGMRPLYYADVPYALENPVFFPEGGEILAQEITGAGLAAWQASAAAYASQISSFWESADDLRRSLERYHQRGGGRLWSPNPKDGS